MTQISFAVESEILAKDELSDLIGFGQRSKQLEWLRANGWRFQLSGSGDPIVGRWYARMKLAGVDVSSSAQVKLPDFSKAM